MNAPTEFHPAQGQEAPLKCAVCGEPVFLLAATNRLVFSCGHDGSPVLANIEATVYGQASFSRAQ